MTEFKLKPGQERFQVVDGPCSNRSYVPGVVYTDIPDREVHRFEEVVAAPPVLKKSKSQGVENA